MKKNRVITRFAGTMLAALLMMGMHGVAFAGSGCNKPCGSTTLGLDSGCNHAKKAAAPCGGSHNHTLDQTGDKGLDYLYSAENLYSCSHHPEVVRADAEAVCGACGMQLQQLSEKQLHELRHSEPKGCGMCAVILPGDNKQSECGACGMKLMPVPAPELPEGHPEIRS